MPLPKIQNGKRNLKIFYNKYTMNKPISRNQFVSLCDHTSLNNWCWNLFCTTCGHGAFKVAFSKLIQGQHPDDDSFWPNGKSNSDPLKEADNYSDFWSSATSANQIKLAKIVAEAKISDIKAVAKFPDWLGYIGLVINHCPDSNAKKIISDSFVPQFIIMTEDNKELNDYFRKMQSNNNFLSINDLTRIESGKVNLDKPPVPLIFDVL